MQQAKSHFMVEVHVRVYDSDQLGQNKIYFFEIPSKILNQDI